MSDKTRTAIRQFLAQHASLTLAYTDADGVGACGLWFAAGDDLNLYFLSSLTTRHGRALRDGGPVAFTVHKDEQDWSAIQGVQGRGQCAILGPEQSNQAWTLYTQRFPFILAQFTDLEAALRTALLWQIRPSWLRLIDNRRAFGHKQEITLLD